MNLHKEIKVLLVEDDEDDYILFKDYLNGIKIGKHELTWANSYDSALKHIRQREFDIYFFDYMLGRYNGLDLIKECVMINMDAPIILLTGLGNHKTDMAAMELGAVDYLVKSDLNSEKLERSIRYSIEQSKSLKKIKSSEEKFRSIFQNSHDIIYLANSRGKIYEINNAVEHILGYSREEIMKLSANRLFQNKHERLRFFDTLNKSGSCSNFEVTLRDKEGNKKYCSLNATIYKVKENSVVYYQGIVHDMTRRKKIEHDLHIAEKLAVTGRVARLLAHEVRNPLTNINLAIEQLEEDVSSDGLKPYFDIVKRNSRRINDLISELMENTKPTEFNPVRIPVSKLMENTISQVMDRAALKKIKIETKISEDDYYVEGDETKLSMAFLNIVLNAIEAVEEGKGIIKITTDCKDKKCLIIIEDNGHGIQKEDLSKIFEPYFTAKKNGMGLGLASAHNIIYSHKGAIDVESEKGKGTKFHITLDLL